MKINTLNIRADATTAMGTGHVMRCIALGQTFKKNGCTVNFLSNCESETLKSRITDEEFVFFNIFQSTNDKNGLQQTLQILKDQISYQTKDKDSRMDWVVLDGYHFGPNFQNSIKSAGFRLMVVDDYNHHPYYHADILLNQNIGAHKYQYKTDPETIKLTGFRYSMIRHEFSQKNIPAKKNQKTVNLLVTMGGADPHNTTLTIVKILEKIERVEIKLKILIGPSNPNEREIESAINSQNDIEVLKNGDVPNLMRWADVAITAAGSTCLELCYTGVPFMMIITAKNQENLAMNLAKTGAAINLGWFSELSATKIAQAINLIIKDSQKMIQISRELVDGQGTKRILKQMEEMTSYDSQNTT